MSDKMRWRYSDTNPVELAVDSATVIEIGDMLWLAVDHSGRETPKPAALLPKDPPDVGDSYKGPTARAYAFAARFLGVAMQRSPAGDTGKIRVATVGVFKFDCEPQGFMLGALVGPAEGMYLNDALDNQWVTEVSCNQFAIGRVQKSEPRPTTSVLVEIRSTVMYGGIMSREQ